MSRDPKTLYKEGNTAIRIIVHFAFIQIGCIMFTAVAVGEMLNKGNANKEKTVYVGPASSAAEAAEMIEEYERQVKVSKENFEAQLAAGTEEYEEPV